MNAIARDRRRLARAAQALILAVAVLAPSRSAWAALGQDVTSVEADRAQMEGSRSVTEARGYTVHEIQSPTGTSVREFVGADGIVFAVAWQGPFVPRLRQLLGSYFPTLVQAASAQGSHRAGLRTLLVHTPELVVETGGHMRALFGRAYIPDRVPQDMEEGVLR